MCGQDPLPGLNMRQCTQTLALKFVTYSKEHTGNENDNDIRVRRPTQQLQGSAVVY